MDEQTIADGTLGSGSTASGPARLRGDARRRTILQALHDCVIDQGYAKTTLADVARAAGMSPSHLLYYFDGTDAILAQYFSNVCRRVMDRLDGFRGEPPDRQLQLIADLFFAGKSVNRAEIGFMLECFGVAVRDRRLWHAKVELDDHCKAHLRQVFERSPCGAAHASAAAEIAYAMLVGMRTAAYFDEKVGLGHARRLFHEAVSCLAERGHVT